jgi:hypothetical protein
MLNDDPDTINPESALKTFLENRFLVLVFEGRSEAASGLFNILFVWSVSLGLNRIFGHQKGS